LEDDVPYWEPLKKFYQVDDSFPAGQLLTRSDGEKKRNIYFVSNYVKQILANNDSEAVRVINAGVKIFMRSDQKKVGGRLTCWQARSCCAKFARFLVCFC
jgi:type III secretory pathway lipoprotein EscJ